MVEGVGKPDATSTTAGRVGKPDTTTAANRLAQKKPIVKEDSENSQDNSKIHSQMKRKPSTSFWRQA